jgi:hypothetical protein
VLNWPKGCKLAHAFRWECSHDGLKLAQLLGRHGVLLTWSMMKSSRPRRARMKPRLNCPTIAILRKSAWQRESHRNGKTTPCASPEEWQAMAARDVWRSAVWRSACGDQQRGPRTIEGRRAMYAPILTIGIFTSTVNMVGGGAPCPATASAPPPRGRRRRPRPAPGVRPRRRCRPSGAAPRGETGVQWMHSRERCKTTAIGTITIDSCRHHNPSLSLYELRHQRCGL